MSSLESTVKRCQSSGEGCSLLCFRIDGNDTLRGRLGNDKTDMVLREVATEIVDFIREGVDLPGTLSNGFFAVVLPSTNVDKAVSLGSQICSYVAGFKVTGLDERFTLSMGASQLGSDLASGAQMLDSARTAALQVESAGGNRCAAAG